MTADVGHTLPIGEPWLPGAICDHFLVSRPYPFGPGLEDIAGHATRVVWLLPVSAAERSFKVRHGLEAFERLLDERGVEYGEPRRACVVTSPNGPI
jgi:hypothetical protein